MSWSAFFLRPAPARPRHLLWPGSRMALCVGALGLSACVQDLTVGALGPQDTPSTPDAQPEQPDTDSSGAPKGDEVPGPQPDPNEDPNKDDSSDKPEEEPIACKVPDHRACDGRSCDCLARVLGVGCSPKAGAPTVTLQSLYEEAAHVASKSELPESFGPREGERVVLLGSGPLRHFNASSRKLSRLGLCSSRRPTTTQFLTQGTCPSVDTEEAVAHHALPSPLQFAGVDQSALHTCADDPDLVGRGDCSNSLQKLVENTQCWETDPASCDPATVHDASAFTLTLPVPPGITSLSFDFAFFSAEYPFNYQHPERFATDAFVVWMESEQWTGNIVTDSKGQPMTINNKLVQLKDAQNLSDDCPFPCNEHRLHGFSMNGHAGTPWLTTEVSVKGQSEVELTFAVLELGGPFLDSYALIDNMRWGCTQDLTQPVTRVAN